MKLNKVHSDYRRDIYTIDGMLGKNKEFSIIKVKKGKAMGGCIHSVYENLIVVSGKIWLTLKDDAPFCMTEGCSEYIPKETAHMFVAAKDSVVLEWGVPTSEKLNGVKDHKQRLKVDKINGS